MSKCSWCKGKKYVVIEGRPINCGFCMGGQVIELPNREVKVHNIEEVARIYKQCERILTKAGVLKLEVKDLELQISTAHIHQPIKTAKAIVKDNWLQLWVNGDMPGGQLKIEKLV
jgi:hypothetical protein